MQYLSVLITNVMKVGMSTTSLHVAYATCINWKNAHKGAVKYTMAVCICQRVPKNLMHFFHSTPFNLSEFPYVSSHMHTQSSYAVIAFHLIPWWTDLSIVLSIHCDRIALYFIAFTDFVIPFTLHSKIVFLLFPLQYRRYGTHQHFLRV